MLTPIAPRTLTNRPIVIPAEREIRVHAGVADAGADIYGTFDGQHVAEGDEVSITRAETDSPRPLGDMELVRGAP